MMMFGALQCALLIAVFVRNLNDDDDPGDIVHAVDKLGRSNHDCLTGTTMNNKEDGTATTTLSTLSFTPSSSSSSSSATTATARTTATTTTTPTTTTTSLEFFQNYVPPQQPAIHSCQQVLHNLQEYMAAPQQPQTLLSGVSSSPRWLPHNHWPNLTQQFGIRRPEPGHSIPKQIFIYWKQGWRQSQQEQRQQDILPPVVQYVLQSWKHYHPDFHFILLDDQTANELTQRSLYITDQVWSELDKQQNVAAQSDVIRTLLLHRYGGIWVDASLFCNRPLHTFIDFSTNQTDLQAFRRDDKDIATTTITKEQDLFPWVPSWFLAAPPGSYMITHIVKSICINQQQEPMAKQNQALRNKHQQTSSPYTTTTRATTMALRRQRNAKNNKTKTRHVNYHHHQQDKEDDPRVSMFQKNYFWWHQFVATLAKQNAYVLARIFWTFASADGPTCSCRPVKLVNGTMTMKNVTSCGPHWYFRHPPVVKRCHLNRLIPLLQVSQVCCQQGNRTVKKKWNAIQKFLQQQRRGNNNNNDTTIPSLSLSSSSSLGHWKELCHKWKCQEQVLNYEHKKDIQKVLGSAYFQERHGKW